MAKKQIEGLRELGQVESSSVIIKQPDVRVLHIEVQGTAPLIQHAFNQKAMEEMLRKHMGISVQREAKKPRELVESAQVKNVDGRICIPPQAFKASMIDAAGDIKSLKKTNLRRSIFIAGQSIPIKFREMVPRVDITRLSGMSRTPDVRFRPEFRDWSARMEIQFADTLQHQTIVDLLNRAGKSGIGEWRPSRNGTFGTFRVARQITHPKEIGEVEAQCSVPMVSLSIPDWAMDAEIDPALLSKIFKQGQEETENEEETEEQEEKPAKRGRKNGVVHA